MKTGHTLMSCLSDLDVQLTQPWGLAGERLLVRNPVWQVLTGNVTNQGMQTERDHSISERICTMYLLSFLKKEEKADESQSISIKHRPVL